MRQDQPGWSVSGKAEAARQHPFRIEHTQLSRSSIEGDDAVATIPAHPRQRSIEARALDSDSTLHSACGAEPAKLMTRVGDYDVAAGETIHACDANESLIVLISGWQPQERFRFNDTERRQIDASFRRLLAALTATRRGSKHQGKRTTGDQSALRSNRTIGTHIGLE